MWCSTGASSAWVHLALAMTKRSITTYINGQQVSNDNIGYATGQRYWDSATHRYTRSLAVARLLHGAKRQVEFSAVACRDNLALGDPLALRSALGAITLKGCAYLGGGQVQL